MDRTASGGTHWSTVSFVVSDPFLSGESGSPPVIARLAFIRPRFGWISLIFPQPSGGGPASGIVWTTHDAGAHWRPARTKPFSIMGSVHFLTPRIGWFFDSTGGFGIAPGQTYSYATQDGGVTWVQKNLPVARVLLKRGQSVLSVRAWPPSRMVVAILFTPDHLVIDRSLDSGRIWIASPALSIHGARLPVLSFINPTCGWLWANGVLYRTTDGGERWTVLNDKLHNVQKIQFLTRSAGFALVSGKLLVTGDGGLAWRRT